MAIFADPPVLEAFAVPENPHDPAAKRLPRLVIGWDWQRYFSSLVGAVDQKPERRRHVTLSAQDDSIGTTPIPLDTIQSGVWRLSYYAQVTTEAATSSSLEVTFSWTSLGDAQSRTAAALTEADTERHQFGTLIVRVDASTPISFATTYASNGANEMTYTLDIVAEALALDS